MSNKIIIKRDGRRQPFERLKLHIRILRIVKLEQKSLINVRNIVTIVHDSLGNVTPATALEILLAETIARLSVIHPIYDVVAGQVELAVIKRMTPKLFSEACACLAAKPTPKLSTKFMTDMTANKAYLDLIVKGACVPQYPFAVLQYMRKNILMRRNGIVLERPEYCFMRVAVAIHGQDPVRVVNAFEQLLHQFYVYSPAVMAQAGSLRTCLTSAHSLSLEFPSPTSAIYQTLTQTALITSNGGSVSVNFNVVPATTVINQTQVGLPSMLRLYDASAAFQNPLDDTRPAKVTGYVEPWHADIETILAMILSQGPNGRRMRYALYVPDLFMLRAFQDLAWTLFSPDDVPQLVNTHGIAFEAAYFAAEVNPRYGGKRVSARLLLDDIIKCQMATGQPMVLFKDAINFKSNQKNMGLVTHGDATGAIVQYSRPWETATTSDASLILTTFARHGSFDFDELHAMVQALTTNLNHILNITTFASIEASKGTRRQRGIAISVQGFSDVLASLAIPYSSLKAKELNSRIMATIYHGAVTASVEFAKTHGCYPEFGNSPLSQGIFQYQLWQQPEDTRYFDWERLRREVAMYGTANSMLTAVLSPQAMCRMTGLTSALGPIDSVVRVQEGRTSPYRVVMPSLVQRLADLDLWSPHLRREIVNGNGSIQHIPDIPDDIKAVYRTSWELGPNAYIDMAINSAPYICHSQHMDLRLENPTHSKLRDALYRSWSGGLKTGLCSVRTRSVAPMLVPEEPLVPNSQPAIATSTQDCGTLPKGQNLPSPPDTQCGDAHPPATASSKHAAMEDCGSDIYATDNESTDQDDDDMDEDTYVHVANVQLQGEYTPREKIVDDMYVHVSHDNGDVKASHLNVAEREDGEVVEVDQQHALAHDIPLSDIDHGRDTRFVAHKSIDPRSQPDDIPSDGSVTDSDLEDSVFGDFVNIDDIDVDGMIVIDAPNKHHLSQPAM